MALGAQSAKPSRSLLPKSCRPEWATRNASQQDWELPPSTSSRDGSSGGAGLVLFAPGGPTQTRFLALRRSNVRDLMRRSSTTRRRPGAGRAATVEERSVNKLPPEPPNDVDDRRHTGGTRRDCRCKRGLEDRLSTAAAAPAPTLPPTSTDTVRPTDRQEHAGAAGNLGIIAFLSPPPVTANAGHWTMGSAQPCPFFIAVGAAVPGARQTIVSSRWRHPPALSASSFVALALSVNHSPRRLEAEIASAGAPIFRPALSPGHVSHHHHHRLRSVD
uniref:Uncharacterized protein n=1 Tax=Plectus sambesii TaxID=2011161 RepID=A0A914X0V1_9BILA